MHEWVYGLGRRLRAEHAVHVRGGRTGPGRLEAVAAALVWSPERFPAGEGLTTRIFNSCVASSPQQGRHFEGPAHPCPGCPPQAIRGLPPRPWVDQHKKRSGEPAAIFIVSTKGSQPAWFTAPVDGPVVGVSAAAPAGTLVTRAGGPIDLAIQAGQHQTVGGVNQSGNGQWALSEPSGTLRGSALGGQAGRPRKVPRLGRLGHSRSL